MNASTETQPTATRTMLRKTYTVHFVTPAFLGNAAQKGQWRTPPFKALLRQWWRIAVARECGYDYKKLREAEGRLFGHASDDTAMRSRVGLRLSSWANGAGKTWPGDGFKNVTTTQDGKGSVRADVYLGYGPVLPKSRKGHRSNISLNNPPAIAVDSSANLTVSGSLDDEQWQCLSDTMQLIHWFGGLGSRSRNGWGSLAVGSDDQTIQCDFGNGHGLLERVCRRWEDCMGLEWPHAIGCDHSPLIWRTEALPTWQGAMNRLAKIKVDVRARAKQFKSDSGIGGIHLLGYPAGGIWQIPAWENARFASPLRFKVRQQPGQFQALIFHVPCTVPFDLLPHQQTWIKKNQIAVWQAIHSVLDQDSSLTRLGGKAP